MAENKKNKEAKAPEIAGVIQASTMLIPEVISKSSLHPELTRPIRSSFQAFAGEIHLISLDKNGNEIEGSDFSIGEHTYQKAFENITDQPPNKILAGASFRLKKNNQN